MPLARSPAHPRARQRGAALLILVAVLGLGASAAFMRFYGGDRLELPRQQRSQRLVQEAREALIGFAATNGRLPRPAVSALDGRENPEPCRDARACTGVLPWVTLGISGADSWSKRLRYSVTPAFAERPLNGREAVADKVILTRAANGAMYYAHGRAECSVKAPCAAAVVLSSGRRNLGVSADGIAQANGDRNNLDEAYNNIAVNNFITRPLTTDATRPGGEFDDIVGWVAVKPLFTTMSTTGSLD